MHAKSDFPVALMPDLDASRALASLSSTLPAGHPDNAIPLTRHMVNAAIVVGQGIFTRQISGHTLRAEEITFLEALRRAGLIVTKENSIDAAMINVGGN